MTFVTGTIRYSKLWGDGRTREMRNGQRGPDVRQGL